MTRLLSAVFLLILLLGPGTPRLKAAPASSGSANLAPESAAPDPIPLAISIANVSRDYGDFNDPFDCEIAGTVNTGDDVRVSCSTIATERSPVGAYSIVPTLSGAQAALYTPIGQGVLTVARSPLKIVANDAARAFGGTNPAFTGKVFGIKNGDPISATYATAASQSSVAGDYLIIPTPVGPVDVLANYDINAVDGILTITPTDIVPQAGWWWEPARPGTGFVIERQGNDFFMVGFEYNFDGTPTWASSAGTVTSSLYLGSVGMFHDGQSLTGPYRQPIDNRLTLSLRLQFLDTANATLNWFSQTTSLQRFVFTGGPVTPGAIQNGWWWNPAESGRAFGIEVQGTTLFMAGYMFNDAGQPTWYLTSGPMDSPLHYSGVWQQYGGGPSFSGCAQANNGLPCIAAVTNANVGSITISFNDATHGTLTLPGGRQIPITKYVF